MFSSVAIITAICLYMAFLFCIALLAEKKASQGKNLGNNPLVYSLSLAVFCSTWTYYGSVGKAATSGMLFSTIYLGSTISILTWWTGLRKMIRLKNRHKIGSIVDLIATRYGKSRAVAAVATIIALVGVAPYVALQLKAVISTFAIITGRDNADTSTSVGLLIVVLMIFFTIMFGVRKLDATERHQGMMVALAAECTVKLAAFLTVGIFVCYYLFDDVGSILSQVHTLPQAGDSGSGDSNIAYYMKWTTYLVLSMSAIIFLPRQFHVAVVENFNERHVRTAMWLFPLYMLLITLFVYPLAIGGLLLGLPTGEADTFVLTLPLQAGHRWLSLFVFIGGFSAAIGMVMISSMTMSAMITNHLLLPVFDWFKGLHFLRRYLLQCRWVAVAGYILVGYLFNYYIGESYMLVNIGMISFAAVLQFAPAIIGGLFWNKGNIAGALCGLTSGFLVWFYTLMIPLFVHSGWLSKELLVNGPSHISMLRPENLFGLSGFDPLSHAVLWTMLINGGSYMVGSLLFDKPRQDERNLARTFVDVLEDPSPVQGLQNEPLVQLAEKQHEIEALLGQYFSQHQVQEIINQALVKFGLNAKEKINILELIELHAEMETILAGSIGAAAAYHAFRQAVSLDTREEQELSRKYAEILADLKLSPTDLKSKVDYYQERHRLLLKQSSELEAKVHELNREIEERRQAELALRESEGKYHTLVDNVNIGVYRAEGGRGHFHQANPAMAKIFGYDSLEEFLGVEVVSLYQNKEDREYILKVAQKEGFVKDLELAMRKRDGTPIWCSVSSTVKYDIHGEIEWLDGVIEDITEKKKLEDQLRHSQKMEAIGTLAGGVAHDFNNILTALVGYGNLLKLKVGEDKVLGNYVDQILISSEKASTLTHSLLAFSRKQVLEPKPVDLNEIVRSVDNLLRRVIGEDIEFRTFLSEDVLIIMADSGQVEQILINLAANSRDAMPTGGLLTITTETVDVGDRLASSYSPNIMQGRCAVISVSDTGEGMDEETRQRIFEPFYTTKEVGKGTGLGLSIVYGIIQQHDGDIHVYSEPGNGTTFRIYFPLIESKVEETETREVTLPQGKGETILVAEDSEDVRELMITVLTQFGYTVVAAVDGEDAVDKFEELQGQIDLLILDVIMPKLDGRETLDRIRNIKKDVKTIFSSGYTADIIEKRGSLGDGVGFLSKPVVPHVLLAQIREILDSGDAN